MWFSNFADIKLPIFEMRNVGKAVDEENEVEEAMYSRYKIWYEEIISICRFWIPKVWKTWICYNFLDAELQCLRSKTKLLWITEGWDRNLSCRTSKSKKQSPILWQEKIKDVGQVCSDTMKTKGGRKGEKRRMRKR